MSRMKRLIETIRLLMEGEFCGYIKINFSQGSLGRIEKSEELEDAATINYGSEKPRRKTDQKDFSLFFVSLWLLLSLTGCAALLEDQSGIKVSEDESLKAVAVKSELHTAFCFLS